MHIPRGTLETNIEMRVPDHSTPLVVICAGGTRSAFAAQTLEQLGYSDVVSVIGGFNQWKDEGREWKIPAALSGEQRNRYKLTKTAAGYEMSGPERIEGNYVKSE